MSFAWALAAAALAAQDTPGTPAPQAAGAEEAISASVTVYEPAFFAQYRPQTARDMASRIPGFSLESGNGSSEGRGGPGNSGGSSRGFGAGGNVLIDGARPSSKSDTVQDVLGRIPASSVQRIELIRGSARGIDMQGKTAVINVIRRGGDGIKGSVSTQTGIKEGGGLSPGARLELQKLTGKHLLEGALSYNSDQQGGGSSHRELIYENGATPIISDRTSQGRFNRYELTGAYEAPFVGGNLRANLNASQNSGVSTNVDVYTSPTASVVTGGSSNQGDSREYGLQYTRPAWRGIEFEGSALYSQNDSSSDQNLGGSIFSSTKATTETLGRGVLRFPTRANFTFDISSEMGKNTLDSRAALNGQPIGQNSNIGVEELRAETAANLRWQAHPKIRVEVGARYETSTISTTAAGSASKDLAYLKPRLLVSWTPTSAQQVSFRAEKEASQLSFNDFTASAQLQNGTTVGGHADIVPDQSTTSELGSQWRAGRSSYAATYTYRDRLDIIDRNLVSYTCPTPSLLDDPAATTTCYTETNDNVGNGSFQSLGVSGSIPLNRFGIPGGLLNARVMWTMTEMIDPTTQRSRAISNSAPMMWMAQFTQDLPARNLKWGLSSGFQSHSYQFRPRELNIRVGQPSLNTFIEYKMARVGVLRLEAQNLTDRRSVPIRAVYGSSGPDTRATSALDFVETSVNHDGRSLRVSLRRDF